MTGQVLPVVMKAFIGVGSSDDVLDAVLRGHATHLQ
jgi:hypothetical protein